MISNYLTYHASLARRDDLARQTAEAGRANEGARGLPDAAQDESRVGMPRTRERGRGYYTGLAMRLSADARAVEIGDGGFTTWTAWLMGNAKERCLVSSIATERLTDLAKLQRPSGFGICLSNTRNARSASCSNGVRGRPSRPIPEGPLLRRGC